MYHRVAKPPKKSFFLFGPRGTGKTTWLKSQYSDAEWFNLLRTREIQALVADPDLFRKRVESLPKGKWIVVDEVQKYPALLDEVHALMNDYPNRYHYALTGSSARKLKHAGVNLLAGRAINRKFFPLVCSEIGREYQIDRALSFGMLPAVWMANAVSDKVEFLEAYLENYIQQEVLQEAAIKRLEPFLRFLEIAGIMNGQVVNYSNIAADAGIGRTTVQGYFSVLTDTLLGDFVTAWRPKAKVKEVLHPKFYFFDPGVVRAITHRLNQDLTSLEKGFLFETLILHELRAWSHYQGERTSIQYWRTPSGNEIDFILSAGHGKVAIEVKATDKWKKEFGSALEEFLERGLVKKAFGVYLGKNELKLGKLRVLPANQFLIALSKGEIF